MQEIPGVLWDKAGNAYAQLENFEGSKAVMKSWLQNDPDGIEFAAQFSTEASIEKIYEQLVFHDLAVSNDNLTFCYRALRDSGQLVAPTPPVVQVTRAGVSMTEAQIKWSEYRTFSETHSMDEVRRRVRTDAGFASFVRKNYEREFEQAGDAATILDGSLKNISSVRGRL
jgi:hypothetical protein